MLILPTLAVNAFAENTEVYGDILSVSSGETVKVPVMIKNNPGLMGFRITVTYPKELSSPKVIPDTLTDEGMLNDSITNDTDGRFDVVWTNSKNVVGDGTLFVVELAAGKSGKYEISLSFSQEDTFNENWEDIALVCKSISVNVNDQETQSAENDLQESTTKVIQKPSKSADEASRDYIEDVLTKVDSDEVSSIVNEELKKLGVESVKDVPKNKQSEFVKAVEKKLKEDAPDIESFEKSGMDVQEAVSTIVKLEEAANDFSTQGVNVSENVSEIAQKDQRDQKEQYGKKQPKTILIAAGVAAGIFTAVAVVIYIFKKNKKAKARRTKR